MPFEQLLVEGLAMGACYGLFGLAVVMIYKTSEVINFAAARWPCSLPLLFSIC